MTESAKNIIANIARLDDLKNHLGLIKEENADVAFNDEAFSMFPLYYMASKKMNFDVLEFEPETIATIINNDKNGDRVNTVIATTVRGDVWTGVTAFDMFVDAVVGDEVNPQLITPDSAEDIISGITVIAGIEGASALPFKTDVVGFIVACLKHDGWTIPPLPLMFQNIVDMFPENEDEIEEIQKVFGKMSLVDIATMSPEAYKKLKAPVYMANYFMRNQEIAIHTIEYMNKTMFDWTTIISGD